jgi:hypothetical protein
VVAPAGELVAGAAVHAAVRRAPVRIPAAIECFHITITVIISDKEMQVAAFEVDSRQRQPPKRSE